MIVEPHNHAGVFIARGKQEALATKNLAPGNAVYGEKLIEIKEQGIEYRVWNPFRSKLAAAIIGGVENIFIEPGKKVLYLGASSGTTVSHVSDIVGPVIFIIFLFNSKFISCWIEKKNIQIEIFEKYKKFFISLLMRFNNRI